MVSLRKLSRVSLLQFRPCVIAAAGLFTMLLAADRADAQTDYRWQDTTSGGFWSASGNWLPSGPASGSSNTADFSALRACQGDNTVHLDLPESIGGLIFGDQGNTSNWTLDNNGSSANVLTLPGDDCSAVIHVNNGTATISAVLAGGSGFTVYGGTLLSTNAGALFYVASPSNVASTSALVLNPTAVESYSGTTTVIGGSLSLNFANLATPTNLIGSGSPLVLGGGTLAVSNQAGAAATSQTFSGLTLNAGPSAIGVNAAGSTNAASLLALGGITRNVGATVNFNLPTVGSITTTTANTAGTILGGWATVAGATWATSASTGANPGAITGLPASAYTVNGFGSGVDSSVMSGASFANGAVVNSLLFNSPGVNLGPNTVNADTLTIASGGVLATPNLSTAGAGLASNGDQSTFIASGNASNELVINQYDINGTFTIGGQYSVAVLTKNGPGILFLIPSYPSTININQGTLASAYSIFPTNLNFTGNATAQMISSMASSTSLAQGTNVNLSTGVTGTIDNNLPTTLVSPAKISIAGGGSIAFTSSTGQTNEALLLVGFNSTTASTYTGTTTIYGGQVRLNFDFGTASLYTSANQNRLNPNGTLYLGGVLSISPNTGGSASNQTLGSNLVLIANSASGVYEATNTTAVSGTLLNLTGSSGSITRNSGATIAFGQKDTFPTLHIGSGTTVSSSALLGGWAVYGTATGGTSAAATIVATDWATLNSGNFVVAWSSIAGNNYNADNWSGQTDITHASNSFTGTTNSVRFNPSDAAGTYTITLSGTNVISSGGIMMPSSANAVAGTFTGGSLTSGNGQDLIVNEYNVTSGASLSIASQITGSIGLTLTGNTQALAGSGGFLSLNNPNHNNNYTGTTAINAATTLQIAASAGQQIPADLHAVQASFRSKEPSI